MTDNKFRKNKIKKRVRRIHTDHHQDHIVEEIDIRDTVDIAEDLPTDVYLEDHSIDSKGKKNIPHVEHKLRHRLVVVPEAIYEASGIMVLGKRIKSLLFTTDIAIIKNSNADAIIAVYPFTPQLSITQAIINTASVPVFTGVGGGTTTGVRSVNIALQAELMGAYGVVVNSPMSNPMITSVSSMLDIPVVATISSEKDDYIGKIRAGAQILNVSGGKYTADLVKKIRKEVGDDFPIIATGGPTDESIQETIRAGANAITYTPPTSADIFASVMEEYRSRK